MTCFPDEVNWNNKEFTKEMLDYLRAVYCVHPMVLDALDYINSLESRIAELEAERRWIPVSEPPKECEMRVFKDGDAWCFVLPDFQDLQVSPSVWMKKGVLDKIYKELRSVRDEQNKSCF